jgi:hypothetical protein
MTLGIVAAGAATMIGVSAGVATGATTPAQTAGNLGAGSHSISLSAPRHASAPLFAGGGAPTGHASAFRPASAHPAAAQTVATNAAAKPSAPAQPTRASQSAHPATASADAKTAAPASPAAKNTSSGGAKAPAAQAKSVPQQRQAPKAAPRKPFTIYDSVTPTAIPPHHEVATYANGGYAVSASQVAGRKHVFWIDTNGSDYAANVLDVEPGDASPQMAANWAYHRLAQDPKRIAAIYTMQSEWPACQQAVARLSAKMRYHIRWWIADPTGVPHILPGADATQWYWGQNFDITAATPNF